MIVRAEELARMVEGELLGDGSIEIDGLDAIETATVGKITFLAKSSKSDLLKQTDASVVLVPPDVEYAEKTLIRVKNPYHASAVIHNYLLEQPFSAKGIHSKAHIGEHCDIAEEVTIEPYAVVGNNVRIGRRVHIGAGVYIGDNCTIGDDSTIRPNVSIEHGTEIGCRVTIHCGTVIGSDGYGYAQDERGNHVKRPQVGIVKIDDDVEIGANCCVDRAAFGVTWIKAGTKIDNLVQVAHNVVVGENCLLVAQSAIAGSTTLGRNVVIGGKASAKGHIHLGDGVMVAGKGGVTRNLQPGSVVGGMPAIPIKQWTKAASIYSKIPDIRSEVRKLRKDMQELQERLGNRKTGEEGEQR